MALTSKALTKAIDVPYKVSARSADRLRQRYPHLGPDKLVQIASKSFMSRVSTESGLVGTAAAAPGLGTTVSAGASAAQLAAFVSEAAHYSLLVADLYGIDLRDPAKRDALVLSTLMGKDGAEMISGQLSIQTLAWFRTSFLNIRSATAAQFNKVLKKWLRRQAAKKAASNTLGRLVPFGIGAVIGWVMGRSMAKSVVEGVAIALGPPPLTHPRINVVDINNNVTGNEVPFGAIHLGQPVPIDATSQIKGE